MQSLSKYNSQKKFTLNLKQSRVRKVIKLVEGLKQRGRLLDIGCSTGDWALFWKKSGWDSYGIDVDAEHVVLAKNKGIKAKLCDLNDEKIPYQDDYFDVIIAGEIIEHLIDTDSFIIDVLRCLKPNGHLLITTPNLVSFENRLRMLLGIYPIWVDYRLAGDGHVRAYTPSVLKRQLNTLGFKIIKHTGNWVPFIPQRLLNDLQLPLLSISGTILPNLAMDIIILAQKANKI
jgi:2-polyprenyl-3-methyl-5-hydroxy-6-metoxy-1,4-benzoquinol methylase